MRTIKERAHIVGSRKRKRLIAGIAVAVALVAVLCVAFLTGYFHDARLQINDFYFRVAGLRESETPEKEIVVIGIDEKSLQQLGQFSSWPRSLYAQAIDTLSGAGSRVIVFDILFAESSPDDELLASSIRDAGNVVLPFIADSPAAVRHVTDRAANPPEAVRPLALLEESALGVGHADISPDRDGVVRTLPVVTGDGDTLEPSLALIGVTRYLRRNTFMEPNHDEDVLLFAGRQIPVDNQKEMTINYLDEVNRSEEINVPVVSFADLVGGNADLEVFTDKLVLIGATAAGLQDQFQTPMGHRLSGVVIHAAAMHTILTNNFLHPASAAATVALMLVFGILCALAVLTLRVTWAALMALSLCIAFFLVAFYSFDHGTVLDLLYPPMSIAVSFVGVSLFSLASERAQRTEISRVFGRFVSPSVAERVLRAADRGELALGGQEQEVTVAFADVRGFVGISEKISPTELIGVLNAYLTAIIEAVLKHDGIVNKFAGDSVMAVWNTPTACKSHALRAIMAGAEAQDRIRALRERYPALPVMEFGVGINTGVVLAGNMGSEARTEFSVIGDAVNVASRLTAANPGGKVWIGQHTLELVEEYVTARALGPIHVKGKEEPVMAYEVMAVKSQ